MEKLNKKDRILVKLCKIISLPNCLGKVVKKLVAENLSQFYKAQKKLHTE